MNVDTITAHLVSARGWARGRFRSRPLVAGTAAGVIVGFIALSLFGEAGSGVGATGLLSMDPRLMALFGVAGLAALCVGFDQIWPARILGLVLIGVSLYLLSAALAEPAPAGVSLTWPQPLNAEGRIPENTALSLLLLGLAFVFSEPRESFGTSVIFSTVFGLVVFALGLLGTYRFAVHAMSPMEWEPFSQMSFPTAACVMALGLALMLLGWMQVDVERASADTLWRAIVVFSTVGVFTVAIVSSSFGMLALYEAVQRTTKTHIYDLARSKAALIERPLAREILFAERLSVTSRDKNLLDLNRTPRNSDERAVRSLMEYLFSVSGGIFGFVRYDAEGAPVSIVGKSVPLGNAIGRFSGLTKEELRGPFFDGDRAFFALVMPVLGEGGDPSATDIVYFDGSFATEVLKTAGDFGDSGRLYLTGAWSGKLHVFGYLDASKQELTQRMYDPDIPLAESLLTLETELAAAEHGSPAAQSRVAMAIPLNGNHLKLVVTMAARELKDVAWDRLKRSIGAVFVLAVLSSGVLVTIFRRLLQRASVLQERLQATSDSLGEELRRRQRAEESALRSELRTKAVVDHAGDGIITFFDDGRIRSSNPAAESLFAYGAAELDGAAIETVLPGLTKARGNHPIREFLDCEIERRQLGEVEGRRRYGASFPLELTIGSFLSEDRECFIGILRDVSERKAAEDKIRNSLKEKEALLREIHHRVKNNLQIISSIFRLQVRRTEDPDVVRILEESQNRIQSIALLHERLYRSENLSQIDVGTYIRDLVVQLERTYAPGDEVAITVTAEDIVMHIDRAIPCGLIINELVTNSLKHAAPSGPSRERLAILVRLDENGAHAVTMVVSDNGQGLPEGLTLENVKSLGLRLVTTLCRQLQAEIAIEHAPGLVCRIEFLNSGVTQ